MENAKKHTAVKISIIALSVCVALFAICICFNYIAASITSLLETDEEWMIKKTKDEIIDRYGEFHWENDNGVLGYTFDYYDGGESVRKQIYIYFGEDDVCINTKVRYST